MWSLSLSPVILTLFMFAILQRAAVPASALHQQQALYHGDSVLISHTSDTPAHNKKQFTRQEENRLRQTRSTGQGQVTASFTLKTNTTLSCSTGLTHAGVYVQVEYRLTSMAAEWISLTNVTLDPTSKIYA